MRHSFTHTLKWFPILFITVSLWAWLGEPEPSHAATALVTNTNDSGAGSLRQTIADASANAVIGFAAELSGATIVLTNGPIAINTTLTIDGSTLTVAPTVSGNQTKGIFSLSNSSVITLTQLILSNGKSNYGGAIYNGGVLTLDRVTLSANQALNGGGLYNVGRATIWNSTLSGNSAYSGGGIDNYGQLTLKNSTLAGNSAVNTGGALYNAGTIQLYNTILADSSGDLDCHNANDPFFGLFGVINANVHSLTEDGSCTAALSGDPKLAPLALVDGALVHQIAADSPAIDTGDSATCLVIDQRQATRPQGSGCDVGAVERLLTTNTPTPTATATADPTVPTATATATPSPNAPTITPTSTPIATATVIPNSLYLPVVQRAKP